MSLGFLLCEYWNRMIIMIKNLRKGIAMLDLVFVIVILAILSAVAVPYLYNVTEDAHEAVARSMVDAANTRLMIFAAEAAKSAATDLRNLPHLDDNGNMFYLDYSLSNYTIVAVRYDPSFKMYWSDTANAFDDGFVPSLGHTGCVHLFNILVQGITDNQRSNIVTKHFAQDDTGIWGRKCEWRYTPQDTTYIMTYDSTKKAFSDELVTLSFEHGAGN